MSIVNILIRYHFITPKASCSPLSPFEIVLNITVDVEVSSSHWMVIGGQISSVPTPLEQYIFFNLTVELLLYDHIVALVRYPVCKCTRHSLVLVIRENTNSWRCNLTAKFYNSCST